MNNPNDVCDIFNGYFTNVALEIGSAEILNEDEELGQIFKMYQDHASIVKIQEHVSIDSPFKFTNVSVGEVKSLLWNIDSSKDTGYDTIPPKLVKAAANELVQPISSLVNMSLSLSFIQRSEQSWAAELSTTKRSYLFVQNFERV